LNFTCLKKRFYLFFFQLGTAADWCSEGGTCDHRRSRWAIAVGATSFFLCIIRLLIFSITRLASQLEKKTKKKIF
jgi:hypothetical protein